MPNTDILDFLKSRIAHYTKTDPAQIATDAVLGDLGLQSIDAAIVTGEVEDHFDIEVDPALIFEHETLESFANALSAKLPA